ncbi:MAG: phenylalanine--tRNA ligase beta subunit-related protein [Dehalococcoidales bacterium]|nr:phenylalanine--tRNA ligase beta subunit-related protein [Dehalococcoidales bacterium]
MESIVASEVFAMFPEYIRGVVSARNINNSGENQKLLQLLRQAEKNATQDPALQDIKNHPLIAPWRQAYQKFGTNPNKFYSSIESLCRRARRGDQIPYINTAVAIFNYFSLKNIVPSGADDLNTVKGNLRLTVAKGDEPFRPFNAEEVEYPDPGEIIYVDDEKVMCRRWNWRQGYQTRLTPETTCIAINVDCLPPIDQQKAKILTEELAELVKEFCGGDVKYGLLTPECNRFKV